MCLSGGTVGMGVKRGDSKMLWSSIHSSANAPCRQALSPSGTRLTYSLTAAACLHNPNQEALETRTSSTSLGLRGVTGLSRNHNVRKSKLTAYKDIYIYTQLFISPSMSIGPLEITPWPSCSRKPCPAHFGDNGANVWGGGGVKHAGVTVYPIATPETWPPGKADIPSSKAALAWLQKHSKSWRVSHSRVRRAKL